ncbi:Indole-3-glycerol phosphate synthase [Alloactinosynnema sp. L-07]|uniref:indole-3-glycerol-phosphate synthase n=1 Tax=Alloactinosynnema sp. L-07 TaxID=1653480 RepID=UPI00065F01E2|nr:indole-3-glycerol-phosphate synthase [Alloactinosynnema sp. L-07]CRK58158.1 Indole-3-glycerol phosphate synthase [Alloactinosynnema sp. L-07]
MTRFTEALAAGSPPVIAEIKPRTADGEDLLRGRTPTAIAAAYADAGAACLSVVTGRWFGGTVDLLREVTAASPLPVLQKDFITRDAHIETAADCGAAAVLLTVKLLTATSMRRLVDAAIGHGITPFVEVTDEAEIAIVPRAAECVIAVNNKDISTRERTPADLRRGADLLATVQATGTPYPVSASGIEHPAQAASLLAAGYRGLLVGTGLLRATDPAEWFGTLATHLNEAG